MLDVINLQFDYAEKPLLQNVSFSLHAGQILHIRGANGVGKTTLLKLLAGILTPNQGSICHFGKSIFNDIVSYQQNLCFVGHKSGVSSLLTVKENCELDLHLDQKARPISELLKTFALQGLENVPCGLLSMGQRRRVALLRLLITNRPLWLLDEPLAALDKEAISLFHTCLGEHLLQNGMVVLTSHQPLMLPRVNYLEYQL